MRKANKQMTLDIELIIKLDELELNVSDYCNEKLWDYVSKLEGVKDANEKPEDIETKIAKLTKQKEMIVNKETNVEKMKKEGITEAHIKFLKSMGTNIRIAKDMKEAYSRKFGISVNWIDLLKLKRKWT